MRAQVARLLSGLVAKEERTIRNVLVYNSFAGQATPETNTDALSARLERISQRALQVCPHMFTSEPSITFSDPQVLQRHFVYCNAYHPSFAALVLPLLIVFDSAPATGKQL